MIVKYPDRLQKGKLHGIFYVGRDLQYMSEVYKIVLGLFKLNRLPKEGVELSKKDYTGFYWTLRLQSPIKR